jgi:hypothetical protein
MKSIPPLVLVGGIIALFLGLFFGLYALLTLDRRRMMRGIREGAAAQGWRYRLRRWQGNPTAFRIEGATHGALSWVMTSGNTRGYNKGWSAVLGVRVPILGGEVDFAVLPRGAGHGFAGASSTISPRVEARVAAFSGAIASGLDFFQNAQELPSGLAAFDAAYEVLVLPKQFGKPPVDAALGERILHWPADTIAPHSMIAWRDAFGLHVDARVPAPANWSTVSYLASLAEEMCARVPAPLKSGVPPTFFDRAVAQILEP